MANKIRSIRQSKNMSQQELSAKAGISRTIISKLETERATSCNSKTLAKIATALETTVDNLFFARDV